MKKNMKIWIWQINGCIHKAVCCQEDGTITIYNEHDEILIKWTGLTPVHIQKIEKILMTSGAKKLNHDSEPFTYL